jgi:hypothetical protein
MAIAIIGAVRFRAIDPGDAHTESCIHRNQMGAMLLKQNHPAQLARSIDLQEHLDSSFFANSI